MCKDWIAWSHGRSVRMRASPVRPRHVSSHDAMSPAGGQDRPRGLSAAAAAAHSSAAHCSLLRRGSNHGCGQARRGGDFDSARANVWTRRSPRQRRSLFPLRTPVPGLRPASGQVPQGSARSRSPRRGGPAVARASQDPQAARAGHGLRRRDSRFRLTYEGQGGESINWARGEGGDAFEGKYLLCGSMLGGWVRKQSRDRHNEQTGNEDNTERERELRDASLRALRGSADVAAAADCAVTARPPSWAETQVKHNIIRS